MGFHKNHIVLIIPNVNNPPPASQWTSGVQTKLSSSPYKAGVKEIQC